MPNSDNLPKRKSTTHTTRWTLVRGLVKGYGGFRKKSKLFTDHEQYLLGITNDQLYGLLIPKSFKNVKECTAFFEFLKS